MARVKRGKTHVKRRRRLRKSVKGYQWGRKNILKAAKTAATKAGANAYVGRKGKKRVARRGWQVTINAALREEALTYSKFIGALKKKKIDIDRKILADIAQHHPEVWKQLIKAVQ